MCGIAGFLSKKFTEQQLKGMTDILGHRGPDADGFYFDASKGIGLGHRRLSILDLSAAANQPFYSADGRYVMIYNGEVYNFREVAQKYKLQTRTQSDSEVIIEAFAQVGIEAINDLNGMFAIAIWDTKMEKLYLIRDRIGIKPMLYWQDDGYFAFASELKALLTLPVRKEINHESISNFLYLGYIPEDNTIYRNCYKLQPGHYAVLHNNGRLDIAPYWQLEDKLSPTVVSDEKAAKKTLRDLLESSVSYCMISDVPVGIFLSGGVDSSTVAAIAQSQLSRPVKTFSIGFKEEKFNESVFAAKVAKHIGSDHHEFILSEQDALQQVEKLLDIYDEPYADSSAIPTLLVSKMAREHVTVALSGDGGDELFMGYGFYTWARRLQQPLIKMFRRPIAKGLHSFGNNRLKRGSKLFDYPDQKTIKSHIFSQEQYYFTAAEIASLLKIPVPISFNEEIETNKRQLSAMEEQSFFDIKNYLPEELLVKTDRASMKCSLEVRVPLLDHRLVEFALNLSQDLKLRGDTGKYLLKEVLYEYVPKAMFDRPKWGFSIPLNIWLGRELKYLLDKYLCDEIIESCGLVNPAPVRKLKQEFLAGRDYLYNRLWVLILLHKWYKEKHS
ncbi:MAG TPA: asparagine synthase (glutamine-hydrolyzing) [Chitinophagaceae bacterium]|jgi:asparagine synthase (glutamine-hydrolysing)|nr:asparagine synthase (glutamine-hydrolyzing) [Chitinophagaceae bacterium]